MPAAYLFDMDGLLLDTERLARACFRAAAAEFALDPVATDRFFLTLIGTSRAEGERMTRAFLPDHLHYEEVEARWEQHYRAGLAREVPVKPTVRDTLQRLTGQGAVMAVVTSTRGDLARHKLQAAGLIDHFTHVLGGDEVPANKPDPAPYLTAAARLGVDPRHCAAFEDSDRGLHAAHAAGCHAVQVPDLRPADQPLPDLGQLVAADLAQAVADVQAHVARLRQSGGPSRPQACG